MLEFILLATYILFAVRAVIFVSYDLIGQPIRDWFVGSTVERGIFWRENLVTCLSCAGFWLSIFFGAVGAFAFFNLSFGLLIAAAVSAITASLQVIRNDQ